MGRGVFVSLGVSYPPPGLRAFRAPTDLPHKGGGVWSEWLGMRMKR